MDGPADIATCLDGLAFIDVETTGLDPERDEVIELAMVGCRRGVVVEQHAWLFRPARPLPPVITALTGLTMNDLERAPALSERTGDIESALEGWTLVAHNADFERAFLKELIAGRPILDSFEVMHLLFPELPSHSLDSLLGWAQAPSGARHRALDDALDTFRVLSTAVARVTGAGRRAELEALVTRLSPPAGAPAAVLVGWLARLSLACGGNPEPVPRRGIGPMPGPDPSLVRRIRSALEGEGPRSLELERPAQLAAVEAARQYASSHDVQVVVSAPADVVDRLPFPRLPLSGVCSTALTRVSAEVIRSGSDADRLAAAWLLAWHARAPHGDASRLSGVMEHHLPLSRAILALSTGCLCSAPTCVSREEEGFAAGAPVVVMPHALALQWLERGPPFPWVALASEQLPEAERRRTRHTVSVRGLDALARAVSLVDHPPSLPGQLEEASAGLRAALTGEGAAEAEVRPETFPAEVRAVLEALEQTLARALDGRHGALEALARAPVATTLAAVRAILAPPRPGRELRYAPRRVVLEPTAAGYLLDRRLGPRVALVGSHRGANRWTQLEPELVGPLEGPASVSVVETPVGLAELGVVVASPPAGPALAVLTSLETPAVVAALWDRGRPVRLLSGAAPVERDVLWVAPARAAPAIPPGAAVVLYGAMQWRAAVLALPGVHVTLASPSGLAPAVREDLADLVARPPPLARARP